MVGLFHKIGVEFEKRERFGEIYFTGGRKRENGPRLGLLPNPYLT